MTTAASAYEVANLLRPTSSVSTGGVHYCSATRSSTAHGSYSYGGSRGSVYAYLGGTCAVADLKAPGNLKVRHQYLRKGADGDFEVCWGSGYLFNDKQHYAFSDYREWKNGQPCGSGVFRDEGRK